MTKKKIKAVLLAAACIFSWQSSSSAALIEILPNSYTFDRATDTGSYTYHDETGRQLIDGQYGVAPWWANLGNGNAYEWVGWLYDSPVNIDFDFGAATQVNQIKVGSVQDHIFDVVLPDVYVYHSGDASSWSLVGSVAVSESSVNNESYRTYLFDNLAINDRYVRVSLWHNTDGPWTFTDEVDFYQETNHTPVPEPGTWLLLGSGLAGLVAFRKRFALK